MEAGVSGVDRAIILAGGSGTRLEERSGGANKHLLMLHDAPMVLYPLALAIEAGLTRFLLVTTREALPTFRALLGDGAKWGVTIEFASQSRPDGVAGALAEGEGFAAGKPCCVLLGDNITDGDVGLREALQDFRGGAEVFAFPFEDPRAYAVAAFSSEGELVSLEEKPAVPRGSWAVGGIYIYDATAFDRIRGIAPSSREEREITDLNRSYFAEGLLRVHRVGGHVFWNDAGTPGSFDRAVEHVALARQRGNLRLGNPARAAVEVGLLPREE